MGMNAANCLRSRLLFFPRLAGRAGELNGGRERQRNSGENEEQKVLLLQVELLRV